MKNQFFYKLVKTEPTQPDAIGSFNIEKVIRSVNYRENCLVILLDDFHSVYKTVPITGKNGKETFTKINTSESSEIFLDEEDSTRYRELCECKLN